MPPVCLLVGFKLTLVLLSHEVRRVGRSTHAVPAPAGSVRATGGGSGGLARRTAGCKCLCPVPQAIKNNAGFRVWVLFFLVMCSFSLLFLDWYDS